MPSMKKRNSYGSVYFSLQCLRISHGDLSVEVGLQRNKHIKERFTLISPLTPGRQRESDLLKEGSVVMIIRTTTKSVYYPMAGQRAEVIRGTGRFRYVRGSLLVNAKNLKN